MRSEYVFDAAKKISNRFLLCRVTSVSARRLQVNSKQPSETINRSLRLIAAMAMAVTGSGGGELQSDSGDIFLSAAPTPSGNEETAELLLETAPVSQPESMAFAATRG